MIKPVGDVVSHDVHTARGSKIDTLATLVTPRDNVALVSNAGNCSEATLVILARCPVNADALDVNACNCADTVRRALDVARRAPTGMLVYLDNARDVDGYSDVALFVDSLPNVRRIFLPFYNVAEAALLTQVLGRMIVHTPSLYPAFDESWPGPTPRHSAPSRAWRWTTSRFWSATLKIEDLVRRPR